VNRRCGHAWVKQRLRCRPGPLREQVPVGRRGAGTIGVLEDVPSPVPGLSQYRGAWHRRSLDHHCRANRGRNLRVFPSASIRTSVGFGAAVIVAVASASSFARGALRGKQHPRARRESKWAPYSGPLRSLVPLSGDLDCFDAVLKRFRTVPLPVRMLPDAPSLASRYSHAGRPLGTHRPQARAIVAARSVHENVPEMARSIEVGSRQEQALYRGFPEKGWCPSPRRTRLPPSRVSRSGAAARPHVGGRSALPAIEGRPSSPTAFAFGLGHPVRDA
jgi:hypothetical protein